MKRIVLVLALWMALAVPSASADPGVGTFTNPSFAGSTTVVSTGRGHLVYSFTTAVDSVAFKVISPLADVCFDTDTTSLTVGSADVTIMRAIVASNPVSVSAITLPAVPTDNTDCLVIVGGATYWIDVTVGRAALETPVVTITGRSN